MSLQRGDSLFSLRSVRQRAAILALISGLRLATTLAAADLQYPLAVAAKDDSTFVADRNLPGIWSIADGSCQVFFQGSKQIRTPLNAVRTIAFDRQGRLLAGDSSTRQVYRFEAGAPVPLIKTKTGIGIPMGLAVDKQGQIFVADLESHRIWKLAADKGTVESFADVTAPRGMTIDGHDRLWVVSHGPNQLVRLTPDGMTDVVISGRPFEFPHHVALDDQQTAYVSDGYARAIWKIEQSGQPTKWIAGEPLKNPVGLGWSRDRVLIADPHAQAIFAADREGRISRLSYTPSTP